MTIEEAIKHAEEVAEEKESEAQDLEYSKLDWKHEANRCSKCAEEHRQLAEWLEELKQLKEQTRWIPVSERLPKEFICDDGYVEPSDYVLVWGDHGNYGVSRFWGNRRSKSESPNTYKDWMDLDWVVQKPIAWMPLPQPYKTESEDKE